MDISFHQMGTFRTTTLYGMLTHGMTKVERTGRNLALSKLVED
jgi:hypothetical protein